MTSKPRAAHQGGTVEVPKDHLAAVSTRLGEMKAAFNDHWSTLLHEAAEARTELLRLHAECHRLARERDEARTELERVARERDAAREALAAHRCHPEQVTP